MVDSKKWEVEKHIKKGRKKSNDYKWQYADYAFFLGVQTFFRKMFFKKFQSDVFFFLFLEAYQSDINRQQNRWCYKGYQRRFKIIKWYFGLA